MSDDSVQHRMYPGSHERMSGPECVCGADWAYYTGVCSTKLTDPPEAPSTIDPETGLWIFDKNYDNTEQVEPFMDDFLARMKELEGSREQAYNSSFEGHIPGIAGEYEATGIYLLRGVYDQRKQDAKVADLLAQGYRHVFRLEERTKFSRVILYPTRRMTGEWVEYEQARVVPNDYGTPEYILEKGKRSWGKLIGGRAVLVLD